MQYKRHDDGGKKIVGSFAGNQTPLLEIKYVMFKCLFLSNCTLLVEPYLAD